jgi:hypothetical protein
MSVYSTLDEGIPSEININELSRRRGVFDELKLPVASPAPPSPPPGAINGPHFKRKAAPANEPFAATFKWVASLPRGVRPLMLLRQYPRIANVMARAWGDPLMFRQYMFELLIDRRGGRKGFPEKVRAELLALRTYFDEMHPGAVGAAPNASEP